MCSLGDIPQLTKSGAQLGGPAVPPILRGSLLVGGVALPCQPERVDGRTHLCQVLLQLRIATSDRQHPAAPGDQR